MKTILLASTLSILFSVGFVTLAFAVDETIWDNGTPIDVGGNHFGIAVAAADFQLSGDSVLTDAHFWACLDDTVWTHPIEWFVFNDDGGIPGAIVARGDAMNVVAVPTGNSDSCGNEFEISFDLDNPETLDGGTIYWFGLHAGNNFSLVTFWERAVNPFGSLGMRTFDGDFDNWEPIATEDYAFFLTGTTTVVGGELLPIDNTALLLAGLQSSAIWMLPVLVGAAGVGAYYIKTRMNKDN